MDKYGNLYIETNQEKGLSIMISEKEKKILEKELLVKKLETQIAIEKKELQKEKNSKKESERNRVFKDSWEQAQALPIYKTLSKLGDFKTEIVSKGTQHYLKITFSIKDISFTDESIFYYKQLKDKKHNSMLHYFHNIFHQIFKTLEYKESLLLPDNIRLLIEQQNNYKTIKIFVTKEYDIGNYKKTQSVHINNKTYIKETSIISYIDDLDVVESILLGELSVDQFIIKNIRQLLSTVTKDFLTEAFLDSIFN